MPYCPECLNEYEEGTTICEDCRVPLKQGPVPAQAATAAELEMPPDSTLVRVRTFSGATGLLDADVAKNILQAEGISSLVQGATSAELLPVLDVPLLVPAESAARAAAILKAFFDSPATLPEE